MRTNNLFRSVLAIAAVLVVAGPGMVLAGGPGSDYRPKFLQLIGPSSVVANGSAAYTAKVTFTNGAVIDFTGSPVAFSAVRGSFSGNTYTAPANAGRDRLTGTYTNAGVTVSGTKFINVIGGGD